MAKKLEDSISTAPQTNKNDASKHLLTAQLAETKGTHFNSFNTKPVVISSGSLKLDNYLKVKTGSVIRMGGPAEVGKTSQAMLFADNFMKTLKNSKVIYINAEAKFGDEIQARTGMKFTKNPEEWEYGTVFILDTNCFDTVCDILVGQYKQIYEAGGHLGVIIDSVDMLRLKSSFDAKVSDGKKPAGVNYLTKELFRHICHPITAYNGFLIMITQYSATFTMDKYEKEAPNLMDGNQTHALNHQASYALYYRPRTKSNYILEDPESPVDPIKNKILGVNARIDVRKSATDSTGYMLELSDIVTKWVEEANKPIIEENEKINKQNEGKKDADKKPLLPLFEYKAKHQGLANFSEYFENNKRTCDLLADKLRTLHS